MMAWIIGWDLILEYAVASMTVAHGWSKNFQDILQITGLKVPLLFSNSPFDYDPKVGHFVATGSWFDLPAVIIALLVTWLLVHRHPRERHRQGSCARRSSPYGAASSPSAT